MVIGASAGGVENLQIVARDLPADLDAAVFVVLHISPAGTSVLGSILDRAGPFRAAPAQDGEPIVRGRIYVAPPDWHLLVRPGRVELVRSPRENGHRPAVDPLFRTAAASYGDRVVGVILSGMLDDGTAGLRAVKEAGGAAIVLEPASTVYNGMPSSAVANVAVDDIAPVDRIGSCIARELVAEHLPAAAGTGQG